MDQNRSKFQRRTLLKNKVITWRDLFFNILRKSGIIKLKCEWAEAHLVVSMIASLNLIFTLTKIASNNKVVQVFEVQIDIWRTTLHQFLNVFVVHRTPRFFLVLMQWASGPYIPLFHFSIFCQSRIGFWSYLTWDVLGSLKIALRKFQSTKIRNFDFNPKIHRIPKIPDKVLEYPNDEFEHWNRLKYLWGPTHRFSAKIKLILWFPEG